MDSAKQAVNKVSEAATQVGGHRDSRHLTATIRHQHQQHSDVCWHQQLGGCEVRWSSCTHLAACVLKHICSTKHTLPDRADDGTFVSSSYLTSLARASIRKQHVRSV